MLFKKLFAARDRSNSAVSVVRPMLTPPTTASGLKPGAPALRGNTRNRVRSDKGFNPYDSGSFAKDNAWERVTRK